MEVYVTFEKDGHGGEQIEKVFAHEAIAQDYIIETRLSRRSAYKDFAKHQLEELTLEYIETHKIVDRA